MPQQHLIFNEQILGAQKKIRWSLFWEIFFQNCENLSSLGLDHTVNNNFRIWLLDTIEEPKARGFQKETYLLKTIILAHLVDVKSLRIFKIFNIY